MHCHWAVNTAAGPRESSSLGQPSAAATTGLASQKKQSLGGSQEAHRSTQPVPPPTTSQGEHNPRGSSQTIRTLTAGLACAPRQFTTCCKKRAASTNTCWACCECECKSMPTYPKTSQVSEHTQTGPGRQSGRKPAVKPFTGVTQSRIPPQHTIFGG